MSDNDNLTYGVVETMGDDVFIIFCRSPLSKIQTKRHCKVTFFSSNSSKLLLQFFWFIRFTITLTIISFSSGRLWAIISVRAASVLSAMRLRPSVE